MLVLQANRKRTLENKVCSTPKRHLTLLGLYGFLVFGSGCNIKDTINYRNTLLRFTDIHIDVNEWDQMPSEAQAHMASKLSFPDGFAAKDHITQLNSSDGILREMNAAGIDRAIVFSTHSPLVSGTVSITALEERIEAGDERLWAYASINVDRWAANQNQALDGLDNTLQNNSVLGVALWPSHQRFRMDDPDYWPIYQRAAARNAPVLIKVGKSDFTNAYQEAAYTNPNALEEAIIANPETQFILSGLGFNQLDKTHESLGDCLRMAGAYENVWLEAGMIGSQEMDPNQAVIEQTVKLIKENNLIDRFLFGSGGTMPSGNLDRIVDNAIDALMTYDYTYDEALAVFSGNAETLFGLSPSVWP